MPELVRVKEEIGHIFVNVGAEYFIDGEAEIIKQKIKLGFVVLAIVPPKGGSLAFELVPADLDISRLTDSNAKLNLGYIMC